MASTVPPRFVPTLTEAAPSTIPDTSLEDSSYFYEKDAPDSMLDLDLSDLDAPVTQIEKESPLKGYQGDHLVDPRAVNQEPVAAATHFPPVMPPRHVPAAAASTVTPAVAPATVSPVTVAPVTVAPAQVASPAPAQHVHAAAAPVPAPAAPIPAAAPTAAPVAAAPAAAPRPEMPSRATATFAQQAARPAVQPVQAAAVEKQPASALPADWQQQLQNSVQQIVRQELQQQMPFLLLQWSKQIEDKLTPHIHKQLISVIQKWQK